MTPFMDLVYKMQGNKPRLRSLVYPSNRMINGTSRYAEYVDPKNIIYRTKP